MILALLCRFKHHAYNNLNIDMPFIKEDILPQVIIWNWLTHHPFCYPTSPLYIH